MATIVTRAGKGSPLTNLEVDTNFTNLNADIALRATIDSPTFTGSPISPSPSSTGIFSNRIATTTYVNSVLQDLNFHLYPSNSLNLVAPGSIYNGFPAKAVLRQGGSLNPDIPSAYSGVNIGSADRPFANIFCQKLVSAADTVVVGTASLSSSSQGGIVLPANTAIGSADAVIPSNLASSTMDAAFAYSGHSSVLQLSFTYSSTAPALNGNINEPVALQSDGTVAPITQTTEIVGAVAVYTLLISSTELNFANQIGYSVLSIGHGGSSLSVDISSITTRADLVSAIDLDSGGITQFTIEDNASNGIKIIFNSKGIATAPIITFLNGATVLDNLTLEETTEGINPVEVSSTNSSFVGFIKKGVSTAPGDTVTVNISGLLTNFTGLTNGVEYYVGPLGSLSAASTSDNVKIGQSISTTEIFIYTTTTIDNYAQSHKKIELTDLSIGANLPASSTGGVQYNNTTGIFTFTPPSDIPNAAFTGIPTAPTASSGTSSTQLATTEFVASAVSAIVDTAPETLNTLNELAAALGDDANFATTITGLASLKAPINSAVLTGTPQAPTAASGTNSTQLATTQFVQAAFAGIDLSTLATKDTPLFTGIPAAPTAAIGTSSSQLATTQFVAQAIANAAPSNSPAFTGVPTAPTAAVDTDTTQLATTAFVTLAVARGGGGVNIDGGTASSARNTTTIALDGGGAT